MAKLPHPTTIDFETESIKGRPVYPPVPIGVSIKPWGKKARYYAWGHASANNSTQACAKTELLKAYANPDGILCQNGKFDVDVAEVHLGLAIPRWEAIHDTMFLLFLDDPHQKELGLKPSAARLLDMPEEERDEVVDWLVTHQPVPGVRISASKQSDTYAMKYLKHAPGDLVGRYANGDSIRTEAIFKLLYAKTVDRGMLAAYDRERRLMPILLNMERQGLPVAHERLRVDVAMYESWLAKVDAWLLKTLKAGPELNLNSGDQLVPAMLAAGKADPTLMPRTPTGKYQTNKEALLLGVTDSVLLAMLKYRTQLKTCLGTFMHPWLATANASGGLIFTTWNQVKSPSGDSSIGTRTGRLSSTPNFQNIPKEFVPIFAHEEIDSVKAKKLARCPLKELPSLPRVRSYVAPFKGEVLIDRDYSQQEPRILAHFDGGQLMDTYVDQPWTDFHDYAKDELAKMGLFYDRKPVKATNLGLIYGMGVGKLAAKNDMTVDEAKRLKEAILKLYPGLKEMYKNMRVRAMTHEPIRTWGGREYYCEDPKIVNGRVMTFDFKLVNVLIQGSAADCTKEAILRFDTARKPTWRVLLNVHDQITVSVPAAEVAEAMAVLQSCMEGIEFDVPMLSEGSVSDTHWDDLKDYDKKGKQLPWPLKKLSLSSKSPRGASPATRPTSNAL